MVPKRELGNQDSELIINTTYDMFTPGLIGKVGVLTMGRAKDLLIEEQERRVCKNCGLTFNSKDYSACPKCGNQDLLVYQSANPVK